MEVFKTSNHLVWLSLTTSCPCSYSYSPLRFLHSLTSMSIKVPNFSTSQTRLLSSVTHKSIVMELANKVSHRGSTSPDSIAIRSDKKCHTYRQLVEAAKNISKILSAADLKTVNGPGKNNHLAGARIGIVAKPSPEFVAGVLGTWFSGGVAVPLALSYPEAELLHVMNDADITMILSTEDHHELMKAVAAKTSSQLSLLTPVSSTGDDHNNSQETEVSQPQAISGDDPALIIYTSGTTGKPKGAVHTHEGILSQVQMLSDAWGYTSDDKFLHCLPLHHVHGMFNALLAPLYAGSMVEFMPKFSVRGIWQRWRESYPEGQTKADDAITVFTGVPTMYTRLIQGYESMEPELQTASATAARKLRLMMCGSSALPLPVMQQWESITGHRLLERYGMTEFVMALSNPLHGKRKGGTVGNPLPGVQAKLIAEDGSTDAESGDLYIKSPSLFKEYWKLPEVTKESFIDGGFFKTGDAARVDEDGYYIILGRTNADILKVGGYKLSALEIEAVLLEHPTISECCVLGLPDKAYGEAVTAIVIPDAEIKKKRDEELKPALSLEELSTWAKEKLAPYKIPTRLLLWESLPHNAMGKVNKKELKKKLSDE
ncbi:probable CoA ligase CCL8 [Salvia splendens]|uniref:probable CoA ligase CCL8 n=1 Tax=Salvia splendens TaxID=180675 RepID=UPI001C277D7A|nr:probable CoA ligase CCL8 [Salvia splendens]XP_042052513.1 probable CoA ligase CCL8 [Salvia splendens]